MAIIIHAIYEGGAFRPIEAVEIPENSEVEVEVRVVRGGPQFGGLRILKLWTI